MNTLTLAALLLVQEPQAAAPPAPIRVPYQLTSTKHVLVRVKLNDKGPFNFILDTGAPALFISEAAAKKAGLEKEKSGFAKLDRLEIEGGVILEKVPCRVEDPFQITGMNKMNLPGVRLDGFMGYSVLARYRITYDFTDSHLRWTKLDWDPPEVFGLRLSGGKMPAEMAAMTGLSSFASNLIGKKPDPVVIYRGLLGIELDEKQGLRVKGLLRHAPAADAGLQVGDEIVEFAGTPVDSLKKLLDLAAKQPVGAKVAIKINRGGETKVLQLETQAGL